MTENSNTNIVNVTSYRCTQHPKLVKIYNKDIICNIEKETANKLDEIAAFYTQ